MAAFALLLSLVNAVVLLGLAWFLLRSPKGKTMQLTGPRCMTCGRAVPEGTVRFHDGSYYHPSCKPGMK